MRAIYNRSNTCWCILNKIVDCLSIVAGVFTATFCRTRSLGRQAAASYLNVELKSVEARNQKNKLFYYVNKPTFGFSLFPHKSFR